MFSLIAILAVIGGLVAMTAAPTAGFLMVFGGCLSARRAMQDPDDLPWAIGLGIMLAGAFGVWQVATFIAQRLP
jgi:hypothetical protein